MENWENKLKKPTLLLLLLVYFCGYLINLTLLPIFNDESIYLDWAWSSTHLPGQLFISLIDAKQPLLIWIFSIFEDFAYDPLAAGRFVSVIIGAISLVGVYKLTQKLFGKKEACIAAVLYGLIPIVAFYNRQALFEAAVGCIGIWVGYATLALLEKRTLRNGLFLGVLFGIGFLIKTSVLIFIVTSSAVLLWQIVIKKKTELVKPYILSLGAMLLLDSIILFNPVFWQTFSSNSRYSYSPLDIFTTPLTLFVGWSNNIAGFLQIGMVFITPFVFVASVIGLVLLYKSKIKNHSSFVIYFAFSLLLEILSSKSQNQRYLSPFIPFLTITAAYVFVLLWNGTLWKKGLVIVSFLLPLYLTSLVIFAPQAYIVQLSKFSSYSETGYLSGYTSGYAVNEAMQYITAHASPSQPTLVLFGLNIGNPESATDLYAERSANLFSFHIDSSLFTPGLDQYSCFTSQYPVYLVTRNGQLLGLDRYFMLAKSFPTLDPNYAIKLYTVKSNCRGKAVSLSDLYQPGISKEQQIKLGY